VKDSAELIRFYDEAYASDEAGAELYSRWRALGAVGKADHVIALCARVGLKPHSVTEVGCGDGALLSELHRRSFGRELSGFEITEAAATLARGRSELRSVTTFDGERLPVADGEYDLAILSHVLEHVPDPPALLTEVARASRAVVVEVPLEANLSARRAAKREGADEVGHLQRFDHAGVAAAVAHAGLRIAASLDDPLPLDVHRFFAATPAARSRATVKWALRAATARVAPPLARRTFTLHHACLCLPAGPAAGAWSG
jgi:SAM-dependent methyltransferase